MVAENQQRTETNGKSDGRKNSPLACYANYFEVGHNAFEFLIDAGQIEPSTGEVVFHSRLAIGPAHAKLLSQLLGQSIDQFEEDHNDIPELLNDDPEDIELTSPREFEQRAIVARRRSTGSMQQSNSTPFEKEER